MTSKPHSMADDFETIRKVFRFEADPLIVGNAALERIEEQLEAAQKAQHVQNLEWAISLAESDPLYAEVFRPYFRKIVDALNSNPANSPVPAESLLDEDDLAIIAEDADPAREPE